MQEPLLSQLFPTLTFYCIETFHYYFLFFNLLLINPQKTISFSPVKSIGGYFYCDRSSKLECNPLRYSSGIFGFSFTNFSKDIFSVMQIKHN